MFRYFCLILSFHIATTTAAFAFDATTLHLMTEPFPPLTIEKSDHVEGLSIDLLNSIFSIAGVEQNAAQTVILPWARAYQNLQEMSNACLFATARTPQREELFKWVGPIAPLRIVLFAKKDRAIKIENAEQLKNYRIGTVRDGAPESILVSKGVPIDSLDRAPTSKINLKKISRNRIDLFAYIDFVGRYYMKELNLNPDDYETVYVLKELGLYYAFNKAIPDHYIEKLQNAYEQLLRNGTYQALTEKYLD